MDLSRGRAPEVVALLLEVAAPGVLPPNATPSPRHVDDPHLDPPPTLDADWVARVGEDEVLHVECQGYRDSGFAERLFRYHLSLVLRYPDRRVRTIALWVVRPPAKQRLRTLSRRGVRLEVTSIVLPDVPAERLPRNPRTACFATGAHAGAQSDEELCEATVRVLLTERASERQRLLAVVLAATRGRYGAMIFAMKRAGMEPVIIEDLVRFGEDRGIEKGLERGRLDEARAALRRVLACRRLRLSRDEEARIDACADRSTLERWLEQAVTAEAASDALR